MMLDAQNLVKYFGQFHALDDVSVSLEAGEVVGFLGPNGAGKSTTMKIITGYVSPSSGSVRVNGFDLATQALDCRRQIGYLPQVAPLYDDMSVRSYLDHVARLKGISKSKRRHEVIEVIECANLQEVENRHIRKLSGGNQRRVGLAQALLNKPPILILDEPTAGLDPAQVANLRELINRLKEHHSILLSTHVLAEVEACCSRVIMLNRGRCILNEDITSLQSRCRDLTHVHIQLLNNENTFATAIEALDWAQLINDEDGYTIQAPAEQRAALVQLAQDHGGLRELREQRHSLEDVFRNILQEDTDKAIT